jgi:hypothetical protein
LLFSFSDSEGQKFWLAIIKFQSKNFVNLKSKMTTTTGHYFKIGPYPKRFKKNYLQTTKLIELKLQCIYDRSFDCPLKSLFFIVSIGNPRWPPT